jgi:hypothetical protein
MAELLECNLCGYKTVRSGMTNHVRAKHPKQYDAVNGNVNKLVKTIGHCKFADLPRIQKEQKR